MSNRNQNIVLAILSITVMIVGLVLFKYLDQAENKPASSGISSIGGDFTLQSSRGPVSLYQDLKGKVVALYFGYASCPDVCPTTLAQLAAALRELPDEQQQQIQPIFVSVDPGRDSVENLAEYANFFYPGMLGLTDTREVIDKVTSNYRSLYKIIPAEDSAMGYTVDHSSTIYIIGKDGTVQSVAQHGTTIPELTEKLRSALESD